VLVLCEAGFLAIKQSGMTNQALSRRNIGFNSTYQKSVSVDAKSQDNSSWSEDSGEYEGADSQRMPP
jgi:hypothetical protein